MVTFLTLTRIWFFNKFLIISQIQFNRQYIFLLNLEKAKTIGIMSDYQ